MVLIIFILFLEKKSFLYLMEDAGADRYMLKNCLFRHEPNGWCRGRSVLKSATLDWNLHRIKVKYSALV